MTYAMTYALTDTHPDDHWDDDGRPAAVAVAPKQWLTPREAAEYLSCSVGFLNVDRGQSRYKLPYTRLGRAIRYRVADLDDFLLSNRVNVVHAHQPAEDEPAAEN